MSPLSYCNGLLKILQTLSTYSSIARLRAKKLSASGLFAHLCPGPHWGAAPRSLLQARALHAPCATS